MSSSPNAVDALIDDNMGGQDIELNHRLVDDPLNILQGNAPATNASSLISIIRHKVSFLSLNIISSSENVSTENIPVVKIVNTSRSNINGKFGFVHSYNSTRERYVVSVLEEDTPAALVYYGVQEYHRGQPQAGDHHTLFLPPTTVVHLNVIDKSSLCLQYIALQHLDNPHLAKQIAHVIDFIPSAIRIENLSILFLFILLPVSLAKLLYNRVGSSVESSGVATPWFSSLSISNIMSFFRDHMNEFFTLVLLLVGTSTIARFLLSEYRLVKEKAEAMVAYQTAAGGDERKKTFSISEMFEYRIDYYFSTSKWAKVALLLSFTFILIAVGAGSLVVFMEDNSINCEATFLIRMISFTVTLGGMLIFALMIGIISDYIAEKVDDLKKGKSRIIDTDHTVMLNWNDKSLSIIQQVALANESEGGGTIVALASNEKEELENTLASALASNEDPLVLHGTEVFFRSGNPLLESELRRVSTNTARCVISLSLEGLNADEADSTQVRQVMALKALDDFNCHVVVEVQDVDNADLFHLVAPDFAEVIVTHDIIGRLMIQCARCPGLANVLEEMMGFEGSEFYFEEWKELIGQSFYDITCRFDEAIPLGIKSAKTGLVYINPENDHKIEDGDKILVLAEDNDSYEVNKGDFKIDDKIVGKVPQLTDEDKQVERILFCGWRRDLADMIIQLDEYVEKGSELWLLNMVPVDERAKLLKDKGNKEDLVLDNLTIRNVAGNPIIRRDLINIKAVEGDTIALDQFDSILILSIEDGDNMMSSDSRALSSLLIIQDIQKKLKEKNPNRLSCNPVAEILDSRTKSLLSVANCKGYIMSNQIISSVIAQVSEEKDINIVLKEILTAEGSETYIRPAGRFVNEEDEELSFWDVALRARQLREVAVGYKPACMSMKDAAHLIINPPDKAKKRKWAKGDVVVTFAID